MQNIPIYLREITENGFGNNIITFEFGWTSGTWYDQWGDPVINKDVTSFGTDMSILFNSTDYPDPIDFQAFVDDGATIELGFKIKLSEVRGDGSRNVMLYSEETGGYIWTRTSNGTPTCFIFSAYIQNSEASILSTAEKIVDEWTTSESIMRRYNIENYQYSPLIFIKDNNEEGIYRLNNIAFTSTDIMINGLSTGYDWYSFLTGSRKIATFYLETTDNEKIYLGKVLDNAIDNNDWYANKFNGQTSTSTTDLYNASPANVFWDYQSGTSLWKLFETPSTVITLKNGSTLSMRRGTNDTKYFLRLSNSDNDLIQEWFIGSWYSGGMEYSVSSTLPNPDNQFTRSGLEIGGGYFSNKPISAPSFMLNPLYNASINDVLDSDPEGDYKVWGVNGLAVICPFVGIRDEYSQAIYESMGFAETNHRIGWNNVVSNAYTENTYGTYTMYAYIQDANYGWDANLTNVDTSEEWKILLGIQEGVIPVDPEQGGGSIGGGGSTGGGQGDFDDTGDDIDFGGTRSTTGSNKLFNNLYLGITGSATEQTNLNSIETFTSNESSAIGGNVEEAFNRLVSLKTICAPSAPITGTSGNLSIKMGNKTVNLSNSVVSKTERYSQHTLLLNKVIDEYFGSFLDYEPYTKIQIYLPFSGVHELNPSEIIGKAFSLIVKIDWLTGDLLYLIRVNDGNTNSVVYRFNGNASTELPLTARDYGGKTQAMVGVGMSAASAAIGFVTSNPALIDSGIIGGVASAANYISKENSYRLLQKGSFSGAIGFLDISRPYLIITRPKQILAKNYGQVYGYPSMQSIKLSRLTGYIKVAECNWANLGNATEEEIDEIDDILKSDGAIL